MDARKEWNLKSALAGKFIVFDGPDGAGKSTQRQIFSEWLRRAGLDVVSCRDPGGTVIGDRIRSILLDYDLQVMNVNCETMLFMASRAQLVAEVIRPALRSGQTVVCDRFVTSTCAYQGAAGYDARRIIELASFAVDECWPNVTILLDVEAQEGLNRIGRKPKHVGKHRRRSSGEVALFEGAAPDAMEARPLEFHRKVCELYRTVGSIYPTPVELIDGRGSIDDVQIRVRNAVRRVLG